MRNDTWVGDWIPHHEVNPFLKTHADSRDPYNPWPHACRDPAECGLVEWHFAPGLVTSPGDDPQPFVTAKTMAQQATDSRTAAPAPPAATAPPLDAERGTQRARSPGLVLPGRDLDEPFRRRRRVDLAPDPQRPEEAGAMPFAGLPSWPPSMEAVSTEDLLPPFPCPCSPPGPPPAP